MRCATYCMSFSIEYILCTLFHILYIGYVICYIFGTLEKAGPLSPPPLLRGLYPGEVPQVHGEWPHGLRNDAGRQEVGLTARIP